MLALITYLTAKYPAVAFDALLNDYEVSRRTFKNKARPSKVSDGGAFTEVGKVREVVDATLTAVRRGDRTVGEAYSRQSPRVVNGALLRALVATSDAGETQIEIASICVSKSRYTCMSRIYRVCACGYADQGESKRDRTNTGTLSVFGPQLRFDVREGFPLVTTKKIYWRSVVAELLWLISGTSSIQDLTKVTKIWDSWADENGDLGPIYGVQWRNWGGSRCQCIKPPDTRGESGCALCEGRGWYGGLDQLDSVLRGIKNNPHSRRHIVSAWNPTDIPHMGLPPCHALFQFNVGADLRQLDLHLYQRSADMGLGVPFNIASYALLLHMVAVECNKRPRHLVISFGDAHVYSNHVAKLRKQLTRKPFPLPRLRLAEVRSIYDYTLDDCVLEGYRSHKAIKLPVAI